MPKVVLILLMFMNGDASGLFTPAPVFTSMQECVTAVKNELPPDPEGMTVHAYCISESEVVKVR